MRHSGLLLVTLGATAITIKLSNVAFSATVIVLYFVGHWKTVTGRFSVSKPLLLPALPIILVWGTGSFLLSGAPFYPSTFGYLETEWAVPIDSVINEANFVYSWARKPGTHWSNVLGSWTWFGPWLSRVSSCKTGILFPSLVFILIGMVNLITLFIQKGRTTLTLHWVVVFPLLIGLAFWFFTAPDPRFANAIFLLLPVSVVLILLSNIYEHRSLKNREYGAIIFLALLICNVPLLSYDFFQMRPPLNYLSKVGWEGVKSVPLVTKVTSSGIQILSPKTGDQCWDSPLPCTPYFNKLLRLRKPGDFASGFINGVRLD